jgi:hypothetical protein
MLKRRWLVLFILLAVTLTCVFGAVAVATTIESPVEATIAANSTYVIDGSTVIDRRAAGATAYEAPHVAGASAIYAKNGAWVTFANPRIIGGGFLTEADLSNELASKYGYAAAVLAYGAGTKIALTNPVITTNADSNANGAYATCGGKVSIMGGSITTGNRLGHGLDATFGGIITASNLTIHTSGANSGAIATDFGGGYITAYNVKATTEMPGSPGIYTAGMSVIRAYNSTFTGNDCEAVMVAHDSGHTYLYNCTLTGTFGLNGHNSMTPLYSYLFMRNGTLNSTKGALITEMGGKSDMTLQNVKVGTLGNGNLIEPQSGRLIVHLLDMTAAGNVVRPAKAYLELSLANTKLNGAVAATKLSVDAKSVWTVTGASTVVELSLASAKSVGVSAPVTITYGKLTIGTTPITGTYAVGNVTFVQDASLVDDYEEPAPPGPPPGTGGAPAPGEAAPAAPPAP